MSDTKTSVWNSNVTLRFAEAMVAIDDISLMENFLRDVMTEKEITEISSRLEAARMLRSGNKYTDIVAATKLSSRTVARISDWMKNGCSGYATVLETASHHSHVPPVRAA